MSTDLLDDMTGRSGVTPPPATGGSAFTGEPSGFDGVNLASDGFTGDAGPNALGGVISEDENGALGEFGPVGGGDGFEFTSSGETDYDVGGYDPSAGDYEYDPQDNPANSFDQDFAQAEEETPAEPQADPASVQTFVSDETEAPGRGGLHGDPPTDEEDDALFSKNADLFGGGDGTSDEEDELFSKTASLDGGDEDESLFAENADFTCGYDESTGDEEDALFSKNASLFGGNESPTDEEDKLFSKNASLFGPNEGAESRTDGEEHGGTATVEDIKAGVGGALDPLIQPLEEDVFVFNDGEAAPRDESELIALRDPNVDVVGGEATPTLEDALHADDPLVNPAVDAQSLSGGGLLSDDGFNLF